MLVYRLQERTFDIPQGTKLEFPNDVIVDLKVYPEVPFGGVIGPSRNVVTDVDMQLRVNRATGRTMALRANKPLFDTINIALDVADTHFEINGNQVRVKSKCASLQDLRNLISALFYAFPAVLNVYFPDPPVVTYATGQVGATPFEWLYKPSKLIASTIVTSKKNQEALVSESWRNVALFSDVSSRRLLGSLHYFHVACRLLAAGANQFEFLSEAILNFSRCLQSLFGDSRDSVRAELRKLNKYSDVEIETKFITALILRNEFDVAHVGLSILSKEQLEILHDYSEIAEGSIRELLKFVIENIKNGEYTPKTDPVISLADDKARILRKIRENLDKLTVNNAP